MPLPSGLKTSFCICPEDSPKAESLKILLLLKISISKKGLILYSSITTMKKSALFILLLAAFSLDAQIATTAHTGSNESKWTFGGYAGLGGSFGNGGGVSVYLSPRAGYKVTENLETGLAASLQWSNTDYYSSTMIGVGPFVNYYFSRNFFLSGMFQEYFITQKNKVDNLKYSADEAALYLGGGYMQKLGERTYMQIGGMYNVLYNKNKSFLGSGFIPSIGIVYGL